MRAVAARAIDPTSDLMIAAQLFDVPAHGGQLSFRQPTPMSTRTRWVPYLLDLRPDFVNGNAILQAFQNELGTLEKGPPKVDTQDPKQARDQARRPVNRPALR